MLKPIPEFPRRDYVKKMARNFLVKTNQNKLPIDVDTLFKDKKFLLYESTHAENITQMILPVDFTTNDSADGITFYYSGFYITLYKTTGRTIQRIRFTKAHELGHIVLKHLSDYEQPNSFNFENTSTYRTLEREADMFAAEILAPTPVLKSINFCSPELIQTLCNISGQASELTVSDLNNDLSVSEVDKNSILLHFHKFIFTNEYNLYIKNKTCPICSHNISSDDHYCPICGTKITTSKYENPVEYSSPLINHNGRLAFCPICYNESFKGGSTICPVCSTPLYNKCTDSEHKKLLSGNYRFCPICGKTTSFFSHKILNQWQKDKVNIKNRNLYFDIFIDGHPLSIEWHYVVYTILPKLNLPLFRQLIDSHGYIIDSTLYIDRPMSEQNNEYMIQLIHNYCIQTITTIKQFKKED